MKGILIKIKDGHVLNGNGEKLGSDINGESYTFWKSTGSMEVPFDVAIRLEKERPQRYEIVDRIIANKVLKEEVKPESPTVDTNSILDQVEKAIELRKDEQIALLNKLGITPDPKGYEFDRVRKIVLSGHKL